MKQLLFSTKLNLSGPWLLDNNSLKALDLILNEKWEALENRRENLLNTDLQNRHTTLSKLHVSTHEINEQLDKLKQHSPNSYGEKRIEIFFSNDSRFICQNFEIAFKERGLVSETPIGFSIVLKSGGITSRIDAYLENELNIEVTPEELPESQELYMALREWALEYSPKLEHRLWILIARIRWQLISVIGFLTGVYVSLQNFLQSHKHFFSPDPTINKANDLLKAGINQSNVSEAVSLLLKIQVENSPPPFNTNISPSSLSILFITIFLLVVIAPIYPKRVIIGIGKGTNSIRLWRAWLKVIAITIPLMILNAITLPYIPSLIDSLAKKFLGTP